MEISFIHTQKFVSRRTTRAKDYGLNYPQIKEVGKSDHVVKIQCLTCPPTHTNASSYQVSWPTTPRMLWGNLSFSTFFLYSSGSWRVDSVYGELIVRDTNSHYQDYGEQQSNRGSLMTPSCKSPVDATRVHIQQEAERAQLHAVWCIQHLSHLWVYLWLQTWTCRCFDRQLSTTF